MKTIFKILFWLILSALTLFCVFWFGSLVLRSMNEYQMMAGAAEARSKLAESVGKDSPIMIGVVCDMDDYSGLYYGAKFAVDKINASGGVNGRKMKIVFRDNEGSAEKMLQVAQEFCDDLKIVAVVGPEFSSFCDISAPNFEYYGILQISPLATASELTAKGFSKFFRNVPNNVQLADAAVRTAEAVKWKNVAVVYFDDAYSVKMASLFANEASKHFIKIPVMEKFPGNIHNMQIKQIFSYWKDAYKFDAVYVISRQRKDMIRTLKELSSTGLKKPVIIDFGYGVELLKELSKKGYPVYMPVFVDIRGDAFKSLSKDYARTMNAPVSVLELQSAEAVNILAEAMGKTGTSDPAKVADALRKMKFSNLPGSEISFLENGDVKKDIMVLEIKDGQLKNVPLNKTSCSEKTKK
jgi:branched-chain amino acid transport system substrate-binding protein